MNSLSDKFRILWGGKSQAGKDSNGNTKINQDAFKVYVASFGSVDGLSRRIVWFEIDDRLFKSDSDNKPCQVSSRQVIKSITNLYIGEVKT